MLTHVFSSARLSHVLRVVWWSPSTTLPPPPRAARVEGCVPRARLPWFGVLLGMVVGSAVPSMGTLSSVVGNAPSLESLPRRSVPQTVRSAPFVRHCSAWLPAIVHCGPPQRSRADVWSAGLTSATLRNAPLPSWHCAGGRSSLHAATLHESALSEHLSVWRPWLVFFPLRLPGCTPAGAL